MPHSMSPIDNLVQVWKEGGEEYRAHVEVIWPELYQMLNALEIIASHIITDPATVAMPTPAPARPGSGPPRPSAARMGIRGDKPPSGRGTPVQDVLPLGLEEEK